MLFGGRGNSWPKKVGLMFVFGCARMQWGYIVHCFGWRPQRLAEEGGLGGASLVTPRLR